jgi:hypothetical protein
VEIGRQRRQQQKLDLIPSGSSETVEEYDHRNLFNTYQPLALETDYVIAAFASTFVEE